MSKPDPNDLEGAPTQAIDMQQVHDMQQAMLEAESRKHAPSGPQVQPNVTERRQPAPLPARHTPAAPPSQAPAHMSPAAAFVGPVHMGPPDREGGVGLGVVALILGLGALGAMAFVLLEPIAAYESLQSGTYSFSAAETDMLMRGRMHEASIPQLAASGAGLLSLVFGLLGRRSKVGKVAMVLAFVALAAAGYVWALYGEGILDAL